MGLILLIIIIILLVYAIRQDWGFVPGSLLGAALMIVLILFLLGRM